MAEEIKTEIVLKEPVNVIIETKKKEDKKTCECDNCFGLSAVCIDLIKWIISTFILIGGGTCANDKIQETRLEIERLEADSKLITAASTRFDTGLQNRISYLNYIKPFISTDIIRKRIDSTISYYSPAINSLAMSNIGASILTDTAKFLTDTAKNSKKLYVNQLKKLSSDTVNSTIQLPITVYQSDVAKFLSSSSLDLPATDSMAIEKITEANSYTTQKKVDDFRLIAAPITLWCKKNYYVEFNNTLRIGINDLSVGNQTINVNFKDVGENINQPPTIKDDVTLNAGQTYTLNNKSYRYQITLNYIGVAGRNPFTKAAYITVATYQK